MMHKICSILMFIQYQYMENKKVLKLPPKVARPFIISNNSVSSEQIVKPIIAPTILSEKIVEPIIKGTDEFEKIVEPIVKNDLILSVKSGKIPIIITRKPVKLPEDTIISLIASKWLENERWRKTHIDNYFISSHGRCFNEKNKHLKNVKPDDKGYIPYALLCQKKEQTIYAHQLVMAAFVGPYPKDHVIDHIDRVKHNNKLENLRYVTYNINNLNKNPSIQRGNPIDQFDLNGNFLKRWSKAQEIADHYTINAVVIRQYARKQKPYYNYIFKYAIDEIEGEEWVRLDIENSSLEVSNYGRVKNSNFTPHFGTKSGNGYREVMVCNRPYKLHHLVCIAFKGDPPCEGAIANHLDEDRANNHIDNLEWVSGIRENNEYSLGRQVDQFDKAGNFIASFNTIQRAYEATGVPNTVIARSCKGIPIYKYDYVFKFKDEKTHKPSKRGKIVIQMDLSNMEVCRYDSIEEACIKMGMASSSIHYYCSRNGIGNGFKWKFGET